VNENKNDIIREAVNKIEPAEGARDRMLANIKRKTEEQTIRNDAKAESDNLKILSIKHIMKWAIPIAACFLIAVIGGKGMQNTIKTSDPSSTGIDVQISNPFVSVDNADQFDEILGISIDAPAGTENVAYSIVDNEMADIGFDHEGHGYKMRASKVSGDFSGVNGIEAKTEQIDAKNDAVLTVIRSGDEFYRKITWTDGKVNYVLTNTDGALDNEMKAVYQKLK